MAAMTPFLAHEKWFIDTHQFPRRIDMMLHAKPLTFIVAIGAVVAVLGVIWLKRKKKGFIPGPLMLGASPERMCGFYGLVPAILAIHVAVTLLVSGDAAGALHAEQSVDRHAGVFHGVGDGGVRAGVFLWAG